MERPPLSAAHLGHLRHLMTGPKPQTVDISSYYADTINVVFGTKFNGYDIDNAIGAITDELRQQFPHRYNFTDNIRLYLHYLYYVKRVKPTPHLRKSLNSKFNKQFNDHEVEDEVVLMVDFVNDHPAGYWTRKDYDEMARHEAVQCFIRNAAHPYPLKFKRESDDERRLARLHGTWDLPYCQIDFREDIEEALNNAPDLATRVELCRSAQSFAYVKYAAEVKPCPRLVLTPHAPTVPQTLPIDISGPRQSNNTTSDPTLIVQPISSSSAATTITPGNRKRSLSDRITIARSPNCKSSSNENPGTQPVGGPAKRQRTSSQSVREDHPTIDYIHNSTSPVHMNVSNALPPIMQTVRPQRVKEQRSAVQPHKLVSVQTGQGFTSPLQQQRLAPRVAADTLNMRGPTFDPMSSNIQQFMPNTENYIDLTSPSPQTRALPPSSSPPTPILQSQSPLKGVASHSQNFQNRQSPASGTIPYNRVPTTADARFMDDGISSGIYQHGMYGAKGPSANDILSGVQNGTDNFGGMTPTEWLRSNNIAADVPTKPGAWDNYQSVPHQLTSRPTPQAPQFAISSPQRGTLIVDDFQGSTPMVRSPRGGPMSKASIFNNDKLMIGAPMSQSFANALKRPPFNHGRPQNSSLAQKQPSPRTFRGTPVTNTEQADKHILGIDVSPQPQAQTPRKSQAHMPLSMTYKRPQIQQQMQQMEKSPTIQFTQAQIQAYHSKGSPAPHVPHMQPQIQQMRGSMIPQAPQTQQLRGFPLPQVQDGQRQPPEGSPAAQMVQLLQPQQTRSSLASQIQQTQHLSSSLASQPLYGQAQCQRESNTAQAMEMQRQMQQQPQLHTQQLGGFPGPQFQYTQTQHLRRSTLPQLAPRSVNTHLQQPHTYAQLPLSNMYMPYVRGQGQQQVRPQSNAQGQQQGQFEWFG